MNQPTDIQCTAFAEQKCIASGNLAQVALKAKSVLDAEPNATVIIFNDATSQSIEVDFRGTAEDVRLRLERAQEAGLPAPPEPRGPGRPKLGVVAREVTLLPRHWDWLGSQPGGASVALRKLVEEAKRVSGGADRVRQSQEVCLRFMSVLGGNLPGFEEATRALYAGQQERFEQLIADWPHDIREHTRKLAQVSFAPTGPARG